MKVSQITVNNIADYIRLDTPLSDSDSTLLTAILNVAKEYISSYTGIPITSDVEGERTLDNYEDFYIVIMILSQDMYDNRVLYVEGKELNRTVSTILDMHRLNLVAE